VFLYVCQEKKIKAFRLMEYRRQPFIFGFLEVSFLSLDKKKA
jgi:hypothetical protein